MKACSYKTTIKSAVFLTVALISVSSCRNENAQTPLVGKGRSESVPRNVIDSVKKASSLLKYGEGIKGAYTLQEMGGEGNCGHFSILAAQELSLYNPRIYSLVGTPESTPRPTHAVVEITTERGRMVADATLGIVYPFSIDELRKKPTLSRKYIGAIPERLKYYGPYIYENLGTATTEIIGHGLEASAEQSIKSAEREFEISLQWKKPIQMLYWRFYFDDPKPPSEVNFEFEGVDNLDQLLKFKGRMAVYDRFGQFFAPRLLSLKHAKMKLWSADQSMAIAHNRLIGRTSQKAMIK